LLDGSKPINELTNRIATRILELYQSELRKPKLKAIKENDEQVIALVKSFVGKMPCKNDHGIAP